MPSVLAAASAFPVPIQPRLYDIATLSPKVTGNAVDWWFCCGYQPYRSAYRSGLVHHLLHDGGANRYPACFLLPVGVVLYTIFGGIKATFLTDYVHTVSRNTGRFNGSAYRTAGHDPHNHLHLVGTWLPTVTGSYFLSDSAFTAYSTNVHLGSPGKVYDLLVEAAKLHPVEGNAGGSYLTMRSKEGHSPLFQVLQGSADAFQAPFSS